MLCDAVVLSAQAPTDGKSDETEDSCYEGLERVWGPYEDVVRIFNSNCEEEDVFIHFTSNTILLVINDNNGARVANLYVKSAMSLRRETHKCMWTSTDRKKTQSDWSLLVRSRNLSVLFRINKNCQSRCSDLLFIRNEMKLTVWIVEEYRCC